MPLERSEKGMEFKMKKTLVAIKKIGTKKIVIFLIMAILVVFCMYKVTTTYERNKQIKKDMKQIEEIMEKVAEQIENEEVGQNAIISSMEVSSRQTGTESFDENDEPGNDSSADNDIVRSFDTISYTIDHIMQIKDNTDIEEPTEEAEEQKPEYDKGGIIEVKAELPEDCAKIVKWETDSIKWAKNIQITEDGRTLTAQYEMEKETATVPGIVGLQFMLKVLNAPNGKQITPTFTSKLVGNQEGEEKTLQPQPVTVSAAPSYNIQLTKKEDLNYKGHFDPEKGNEVQEPTQNSIYGRMQGYAITLQLYNTDKNKKLKGIELPKGDITFDISFNTFNGTTNISQMAGYTPILWEYTENEPFETGTKGNNLIWNGNEDTSYGRQIAPYNTGGNKDSCYNGGSWNVQRDSANQTLYHVTIKNYKFKEEEFQFPTKNAEDTQSMQDAYGENVGCFSAGYIQTIMQMPQVVDSIKNVGMQVKVSNLKATSVSNQKTKEDQKSEDNLSTEIITLYPEGNYNKSNYFGKGVFSSQQNLASSLSAGNACASIGQSVYVVAGVQMGSNNDQNIKSINILQKFDGETLVIPEDLNSTSGKKVGSKGNLKTLYAAKPDKTGWKDDNEMQEAKEQELIYFSSMFELKESGYKCIGVLFEDRNVEGKANDSYYYGIRTFINEDAEIGKVYQTVNDVTIWRENTDFTWANKKYTYNDKNGLVYEDLNYPEPLATEYNGKNANTPKYIKTEYEPNGQIELGTHNGIRSGNSIVIRGADLEITKTSDKSSYHFGHFGMDEDFKINYKLSPSLMNNAKDSDIKGIAIKITDTIPKGLKYNEGSCNQQEPEITVNKDGSTTLVWYIFGCKVNQSIPAITYSATIEENILADKAYISYAEIEEILSEGEKTKIGPPKEEKAKSQNTIDIISTGNYSFYKMTTTPKIEPNGIIHYKIFAFNNYPDYEMQKFRVLDKLATDKKAPIQLQKVELSKKNVKTNQTVDTSNLTILSANQDTLQTVDSNSFGEDGDWKVIPEGQVLPEGTMSWGIGVKGTLEMYTQIEIDIYLKTQNNQANDVYESSAQINFPKGAVETAKTRVEVINRKITGNIWEDYNRNGIMEYFEEKVKNVEVALYDFMNTQIATTTTDENGKYQFEGIAKGEYKVKIIPPQGYYMTQKKVGIVNVINSKFNQANNTTDMIQLGTDNELQNIEKNNINAGLYRERYLLHVTNYRAESNTTIRNAIYNISGNGIGLQGPEFKTDKNGQFELYLVPNETYIMKQTYVSSYDYMLKEEPVIFKVVKANDKLQLEVESGTIKQSTIEQATNGEISNVYIDVETEPKYNIRITQYEKDTNNTISYVRFRVKGKGMEEEGKVFQTNVNGIATISSLELNQTYTVEEEYAKGYYYKGRIFTIKMIRNNGKLEIEYRRNRDTRRAIY